MGQRMMWLNLVPLVVIIALVLMVVVWNVFRSRDTERQPRWIVWVIAILIFGGATLVLARWIQRPPETRSVERQLIVECPGADIYFGSRLMGQGRVDTPITGDEEFCVEIEPGLSSDEIARLFVPQAELLVGDLLPYWHTLDSREMSYGAFHSLPKDKVLVRRADGSLDSFHVVVFADPLNGTLLAFPIRARNGDACRVNLSFRSGHVSGRGYQHVQTLTGSVREAPESGPGRGADEKWWLRRFPDGTPRLAD